MSGERMRRTVIVAYRPRPGKEAQLEALVARHVPALRAEGLVTDREPVAMRALDGTIIEIFEWQSAAAIEAAHGNAAVQALWARFAEVCDYLPVGQVRECAQVFSEFDPL